MDRYHLKASGAMTYDEWLASQEVRRLEFWFAMPSYTRLDTNSVALGEADDI